MSVTRHELRLPELDVGSEPITASMWLVRQGAEVAEGDRLLEVLTTGATVDLPSPASGRLIRKLVDEDEPLTVGQRLAIIESAEDRDADTGR